MIVRLSRIYTASLTTVALRISSRRSERDE
jgi:hypothetical protein